MKTKSMRMLQICLLSLCSIIFIAGTAFAEDYPSQVLNPLDSEEDLEGISAQSASFSLAGDIGQQMLKVDFEADPDGWPSIQIPAGITDWSGCLSGCDALAMDVTNPDNAADCLVKVRIDDGSGNQKRYELIIPAGRTVSVAAALIDYIDPLQDYGMLYGIPSKYISMKLPMSQRDVVLNLSNMATISIFLSNPTMPKTLYIDNIRLLAGAMDRSRYTGIVDRFGQYSKVDWPGKIKDDPTGSGEDKLVASVSAEDAEIAGLSGYPAKPANWDDTYGGWKDGPTLAPTGFFRAEFYKGRWQLVTPDGRLFFITGIHGVSWNISAPIAIVKNIAGNIEGPDGQKRNHYYIIPPGSDKWNLRKNLFEWIPTKETDFVWREGWSSSTEYHAYDCVEKEGKGYLCSGYHMSGTFEDDFKNGYWELLAGASCPGDDYPEHSDPALFNYHEHRVPPSPSSRSNPFNHGMAYNFYQANAHRKYAGDDVEAKWNDRSFRRMRSWGFNALGGNASFDMIEKDIPYQIEFRITSGGYPPDPFSAGFAESRRNVFEQGISDDMKGDPYLIGYYVDNEVFWGRSLDNEALWGENAGGLLGLYGLVFDVFKTDTKPDAKAHFINEILKPHYGYDERNPDASFNLFKSDWDTGEIFNSWDDLANKDLWTGLIGEKYINDTNISREMRYCLSRMLISYADRYFYIINDELKKCDTNHMYLGSRFLPGITPDEVLYACGKNCDVFSFNYFFSEFDPENNIEYFFTTEGVPGTVTIGSDFKARINKPVIISCFSMVEKSGLFFGGQAKEEMEHGRAARYSDYMEGALRHPNFVGSNWHNYVDQALVGAPQSAECSEVGIVSVTDTPYPELVSAMRDRNHSIYNNLYGGWIKPEAPQNLTATVASISSVRLRWETDPIINTATEYEIRRTSGLEDIYTMTINADGLNTYEDKGLEKSKTYRYTISARNSSGYSDPSNEVFVSIRIKSPINLTAAAVSESEIRLNWQDMSDDETGFQIFRKINGTFTAIASVGRNVTTYIDKRLNSKAPYTYRVRAYSARTGVAVSYFSNEASTMTK